MIYDVYNFDYNVIFDIGIQKRKRGNQGTSDRKVFKDVICAFDIESTRIKEIEQSVMYIWQFQLGQDYTIIGRTWDEFTDFLRQMEERMEDNEYLCIYVHNLSYEFQFLSGIYKFMPTEVFAIDSRKILKCEMYNHFEFRCSYLHSAMSLSEYTKKMGVEAVKLSGEEFDYAKPRYPWTELSDFELQYCINDVKGLVQALYKDIELEHDNLYTFPLTSTGYVRRDVKKAMRFIKRSAFAEQLPNLHIYHMCREAFRGGDTHASRFVAKDIISNVTAVDRSSSYPDVICNCKFPVGHFYEIGRCSDERLVELIGKKHRAVLMRVAIEGIELRDVFDGCPYIPVAKCRDIRGAVNDNGRVLSADYLEITLTDIDFRIIIEQYKWTEFKAYDVAHARYGYLPKPFTNKVREYYRIKTELKGDDSQKLFYDKSKAKLNSIYGFQAQSPVKASVIYKVDAEKIEDIFTADTSETEEELLRKFNKKAFTVYQHGVWTTAWARYRLREMIDIVGPDFCYCDTDSVYYTGTHSFESYNEKRVADSTRTGSFAVDSKGVTHYMGVAELDKHRDKFITFGRKKYAYESNGHLNITISGVSKKAGAEELAEAGGLQALTEGFKFVKAGGTESLYNDRPPMTSYTVDGHILPITANVVIRESTYTVGITADYREILSNAIRYKRVIKEMYK